MDDNTYIVHLECEVHDKERLFEVALEHMVNEGIDKDDATNTLRPGGEICPRACLQMLLDRSEFLFDAAGILHSEVEAV